ncbi:hypothetical protein WG66_009215 [Moniliophthora roreri]|nr:hypothetical protein WG66_009215 [Moniliophthora roreri]
MEVSGKRRSGYHNLLDSSIASKAYNSYTLSASPIPIPTTPLSCSKQRPPRLIPHLSLLHTILVPPPSPGGVRVRYRTQYASEAGKPRVSGWAPWVDGDQSPEAKASNTGIGAPILVDKEVEAKSPAVSPNVIASLLNTIRSTKVQRDEVDRKLADLEQQARGALDSVNAKLCDAKDELERIAEEENGFQTLKKGKVEVEVEKVLEEVKGGKENADSELRQVKEVLDQATKERVQVDLNNAERFKEKKDGKTHAEHASNFQRSAKPDEGAASREREVGGLKLNCEILNVRNRIMRIWVAVTISIAKRLLWGTATASLAYATTSIS